MDNFLKNITGTIMSLWNLRDLSLIGYRKETFSAGMWTQNGESCRMTEEIGPREMGTAYVFCLSKEEMEKVRNPFQHRHSGLAVFL